MLQQLFILMTILLQSDSVQGIGRYSELVFHLKTPRELHVSMIEQSQTLVLELRHTHADELKSLDLYDETVIRRIVAKESAGGTLTLHIALKDENVRATVSEYHHPFRVSIELFDDQYKKQTDPMTGLPLPMMRWQHKSLEGQPAQHKMMAPKSSVVIVDPKTSVPHTARSLAKKKKASAARGVSESTSTSLPSSPRQNGKRRLLQPAPKQLTKSKDLAMEIEKTSEGRGPAWQTFPKYIFPIQVAALHKKKSQEDWERKARMKAVKDHSAMADYALQLFTFGHESRALVAYQQVLFHDAAVFSREPLHLWAFAESHLGQGNLTLAQGYYDALAERYPGKIYAKLAQLRRFDIRALQLMNRNENADLKPLIAKVNSLKLHKGDHELKLHRELRRIWWSQSVAVNSDRAIFPKAPKENLTQLKLFWANVESRRTSFLTLSLLLHNALQTQWNQQTNNVATEWLKRYEHDRDPWVKDLLGGIESRIEKDLIQMSSDKKFIEVIEAWEHIPDVFHKLKQTPLVSWAVAEAYRQIGQIEEAKSFYEIASRTKDKKLKFKSYFWLAEAALQANSEKQQRQYDSQMQKTWSTLQPEKKHQVRLTYQEYFIDSMIKSDVLQTPPKIVLETWEDALHTKMEQSGGENWRNQYSPNLEKLKLLVQLRMKFQKLGLDPERRRTILLFKKFKPSDFKDDQQMKETWAEELVSLAEEYRHADQLLKSGRLYAFTARQSEDWSGRTEALYKGGLLLYKSGRREEAMKALTEASQDGDSLFYSNLAKERLRQLIQ